MSNFLNRMNYDDVTFNNEVNSNPRFFVSNANTNINMIYSSANFYRHESNDNIEIVIPQGVDIIPSNLYKSGDFYLPIGAFNTVSPITEIGYPNSNHAVIFENIDLMHDIRIQYKLTKSDDTNYKNTREIRTILVKDDETTIYDNTLFANNLPDSGAHDNILIKGKINHQINDKVKIRMTVMQDNTDYVDNSTTKMTIFRISWVITGIKSVS